MIPNATQERAEKLLELYSAAEALLLQKIASRLKIGKTANAPLWVQKKLREIDALKRELQGALDRLERASADERIALMWAAHDEGADGLRRELNLPEAQAARSQAVVSLIDDMEGRFSELHRRILRDAQDVYRDVLYQALPMAAMGVETTRQALQRALNAFADRGITGFVDKAGRHWGIAEYAEMATRTGMMNAALAGYTQEALNHDEDLVIISDHADECPLCAPWERKVLSLTGAQRYHPDCQGVLADALAAGLFHPNCLHSMTVYVPGLTDRTGSKERAGISAEADAAGYSNRQQQRYMERTVRKWKRRQAVAMTPEEERYAKAYVDRWQARLRSLTGKGAKLPRKYDREGGRVLLSDAAKKLKPLKLAESGGIIQTSTKAGGEGVKFLCELNCSFVGSDFGRLNTYEVVLTEERAEHIRTRHPEDYKLFERYGVQTITDPDLVLRDEKNPNTVLMFRRISETNLNTVIRLSVSGEDDVNIKNSVMTFYRVRDKNLKKLEIKNKTVYKRPKP